MRTSLIIKRYCTFLLIILGLTSSVMSFAAPANFSSKQAQPEHLELFIKQIISVDEYRNFKNTSELNRVSAWLKEQMRLLGIPCQFQNYIVNSLSYRNVVCQLNTKGKTKLVIGAHYDVFSDLYGADNNASGVAGYWKQPDCWPYKSQNSNIISSSLSIHWRSHHISRLNIWEAIYMPKH